MLAPSIPVPAATNRFNTLPLAIALFCLLWSFAFIAGKIGVTYCPPLILLTARFSLAGILILGLSAVRGDAWQLTWREVAIFALLGLANNALYLGLGYTGLQWVSAGLGGLIVSANPVFTAVLAALFLGEALTWRKIVGLMLGVAGVAFIVWHRISVGSDSLHGVVFTFASLASIVAGTILFKLFAPKGSLWIGNGIQNLAAGIVLAPIALTFADVHAIVPSARLAGAFAFLVLGGSILAYLLWFHLQGLRRHCGQRLSLPDAAARHPVRLPGARRARRGPGPARHCAGCARYLSRDSSGCGDERPIKQELTMSLSITLIGGPTALIEIDGLRIVTDPTFDAPGAYQLPHVKLEKLSGPALSAQAIGDVDAVLLSHDQHADNLDHSGKGFLARATRVLTTQAGAGRLGNHAEGLAPWASTELEGKNGVSLTVTATPARHGPAGIEPLSGDVVGFVVARKQGRPIYISGDTVWFDGVAEVARRFNASVVLPFAGAAQTRGPFHLTMDTNDTIETAHAFPDAVIIPLHTDGWAHFLQNAADLRVSFDALGFGKRLKLLEPGVRTVIEA